MKTATLPEFKGKPLIEVPSYVPQAEFLRDNFGQAVLEEVQERTEADYKDNSALKVLSYNKKTNIVQGSNPFVAVLINKIIRDQGLRTATQADLEKILRISLLPLQGQYEDTSLVLRSDNDSYQQNDYLAKDLASQIKKRQPKIELPVMIPFTGLELRLDQDSHYGLAFNLREDANIIYDSILKKPTSNFEETKEDSGLPKELGKGNRTLYTRQDGLSRLYLSWYLYLSSVGIGLAGSNSDGRVVVVSGEAAQKDLKKDSILRDVEERHQAELKVAEARYQEAKKAVDAIYKK